MSAAAASSTAAAQVEPVQIHIALPKGHMQENIFSLLAEAGLKVGLSNSRGYRPTLPLRNYDVKLLKPQNILGMLHAGTRDVGFAGYDWCGGDVRACTRARLLLDAESGAQSRRRRRCRRRHRCHPHRPARALLPPAGSRSSAPTSSRCSTRSSTPCASSPPRPTRTSWPRAG